MAQYDLLLTQNVHATLTEYSEKFVNITKGDLLSSDGSNVPTVLAGGTDGYVLVRDDVEVTGLKWVTFASLGGVTVANQADDRVITATAVTDALNGEANLTYNTTQGLLIGSGAGIIFTAAATTYKIYTPPSALKASITIETGTNSAAGAGDITLKAGAGISAGGNVYFQRDTTWGNFYFGTGAAGQLPAKSSETSVIYYNTTTGLLSYGGADLVAYGSQEGDIPTTNVTLDGFVYTTSLRMHGAQMSVYGSVSTFTGSDYTNVAWNLLQFYHTGIHYIRSGTAGGYMAFVVNNQASSEANSSLILHADYSVSMPLLGSDDTEDHVLAIDDTTGLITKRAVSTIGGGGNVTSTTNGNTRIAYFTATANDIEGSTNYTYDGSKMYILIASASDTGQSEGIHVHSYGNQAFPGKLNFVKQRSTGSTALDNDKIGSVTFQFFNDNAIPETIVGAGMSAQVIDASDAIEDVELSFWQYEAGVLTTYTLSDLAVGASGGGWTVAANVISPTVSGDDVRLAATEQLQFIDTTKYIVGPTGYIDVYNVGHVFRFAALTGTHITYNDILAGGTGLDVGGSGQPFNSMFANRYYVGVVGNYLDVSGSGGSNMTFTDTNTGTKTLTELATGGTVTSVSAGNGMTFTTITGSGPVTMGTPGSVTATSTNAVASGTHTHAITESTLGAEASTVSTLVRRDVGGDIKVRLLRTEYTTTNATCAYFLTQVNTTTDNYARPSTVAQVVAYLDGQLWTFTAANNVTAGSFQFYDNVEIEMGSGNDYSIYYSGTHLYFDGLLATSDIYFRTGTTTRFTFDMGTYTGTATDWIATSDVRLKTNIRPFNLDMDKFIVMADKAVRYNWNAEWMPEGTPEIGFIAQDIEALFPELVSISSEKPYFRGLSYGKMVTVAIKATAKTWEYALQIDSKLDVVQSEVEELKIKVDELENKLNTLQNG